MAERVVSGAEMTELLNGVFGGLPFLLSDLGGNVTRAVLAYRTSEVDVAFPNGYVLLASCEGKKVHLAVGHYCWGGETYQVDVVLEALTGTPPESAVLNDSLLPLLQQHLRDLLEATRDVSADRKAFQMALDARHTRRKLRDRQLMREAASSQTKPNDDR